MCTCVYICTHIYRYMDVYINVRTHIQTHTQAKHCCVERTFGVFIDFEISAYNMANVQELGTVLRTGSLGEINEAEAVECDRLVAAAST